MNRLKIYLDTSVISHLDAPDTPEKMRDTLRLWDMLESGWYDVVLSETVLDELEACSEPKKSIIKANLNNIKYEIAATNDALRSLAGKFIDFGILKEKSFDDCRHIAAALLSGCDIVVSWNFKHFVNAKTIRGTRSIAATGGFRDIMICTPTMLVEGESDYD